MKSPETNKRLPGVALWAWAAVLTIIGVQLMRSHWAPLARPDIAQAAWVDQVRQQAPRGQWTALHVLSSECECSRRVLRHLREQSPVPGVIERVLWIAEPTKHESPPNVPAWMQAEVLSSGELEQRFGVTSAPLLMVLGPDGVPQYAGGYTARKQGPDLRDRELIRRTIAGERPEPNPVFGCPFQRNNLN